MALSLTTDWCKMRYNMFVIYFVSVLLASSVAGLMSTKHKRQIFREQLLPQTGGKIPSTAFEPDRLFINKISQHGFYSLDGQHLDQRHPNRHHQAKKLNVDTLQVKYEPDTRFVAPPGQYSTPENGDSSATTYLVQKPVNYYLSQKFKHYNHLPLVPFYSLKYVREFKYGPKSANDISGTGNVPEQIFNEHIPYVRHLL